MIAAGRRRVEVFWAGEVKWIRRCVALAAGFLATGAFAQTSDQVDQTDPADVVRVLAGAGFSPTLGENGDGTPRIALNFGGYAGHILFFDCVGESHCQGAQLQVALDAGRPISRAEAEQLVTGHYYIEMSLDDPSEPVLVWTMDGLSEGRPAASSRRSYDTPRRSPVSPQCFGDAGQGPAKAGPGFAYH